MPKAALPTTPKGWLVTVAASLVGFVAGTAALGVLARWAA